MMWPPFTYGPRCEKTCFRRFVKKRCRPACASAQSDQRLCYSFLGKHHIYDCYERNFDFLASLCSCGDWFESHFVWDRDHRFSRDEAHIWWIASSFFFVLNIIICCPCNICPRAVEIRGHDARKPVFWVSDKASLKPVASA